MWWKNKLKNIFSLNFPFFFNRKIWGYSDRIFPFIFFMFHILAKSRTPKNARRPPMILGLGLSFIFMQILVFKTSQIQRINSSWYLNFISFLIHIIDFEKKSFSSYFKLAKLCHCYVCNPKKNEISSKLG
jgi:hypothetical protein